MNSWKLVGQWSKDKSDHLHLIVEDKRFSVQPMNSGRAWLHSKDYELRAFWKLEGSYFSVNDAQYVAEKKAGLQ